MTQTASRRRRPYAGSRFSDPDWANLPAATPPAGFPPLADDEPDEPGFHEPAPSDDSEPAADDPSPRRAARRAFSPPDTGDASGFVLGLFGTVLFLQFLHGGPAQVRKWLAAKFLNRDGDGYGPATNGRTIPIPAGGDPGKPGTSPVTGAKPDRGLGALPDPSRLTSPSATDSQGRPF